eukprot:SM000226S07399  [mRNA]  locus=s226:1395:6352:+ [translate_table: standard]
MERAMLPGCTEGGMVPVCTEPACTAPARDGPVQKKISAVDDGGRRISRRILLAGQADCAEDKDLQTGRCPGRAVLPEQAKLGDPDSAVLDPNWSRGHVPGALAGKATLASDVKHRQLHREGSQKGRAQKRLGEDETGPSAACEGRLDPPAGEGIKALRQWEAWTTEEEEAFFAGLQVVGKNFEGLRSIIRSKNKDQVRFYYYRLIKRMNKLMGPGFNLDPKNDKEANLAMHRWWMLTKSHKLDLAALRSKPKRRKMFARALEEQLLLDRKKAKRREASLAVAAANEVAPVAKSFGVDIANPGSVKPHAAASNRNSSFLLSRAPKLGPDSVSNLQSKPGPAQRRRPSRGVVTHPLKLTATEWEKAACHGVSMMAEAAAHLEQFCNKQEMATPVDQHPSTPDKVDEANTNCKVRADELPPQAGTSSGTPAGLEAEQILEDNRIIQDNCEAGAHPPAPKKAQVNDKGGVVAPGPLCYMEEMKFVAPKLKLQLLPMDDVTSSALQQMGHNPHLQLTFKARKSISSVIQHLSQKWGNCAAARGNLRLFAPTGNSWGPRDAAVYASDIHAALGKPGSFQLRYAWVEGDSPALLYIAPEGLKRQGILPSWHPLERQGMSNLSHTHDTTIKYGWPSHKPQPAQISGQAALNTERQADEPAASPIKMPSAQQPAVAADTGTHAEQSRRSRTPAWMYEESQDGFGRRPWEEEVAGQERYAPAMCAPCGGQTQDISWVDSITNISMTDLLGDAPAAAAHTGTVRSPAKELQARRQNVAFRSLLEQEDTQDTCAFALAVGHISEVQRLPSSDSSRLSMSAFLAISQSKDVSNNFQYTTPVDALEPADVLAEEEHAVLPYPLPSVLAESDNIREGEYLRASTQPGHHVGSALELFWPDSLGSMDIPLARPLAGVNPIPLMDDTTFGIGGTLRSMSNILDGGSPEKEPLSGNWQQSSRLDVAYTGDASQYASAGKKTSLRGASVQVDCRQAGQAVVVDRRSSPQAPTASRSFQALFVQ